MTIRDLIDQLQRFAAEDLKGGDMEVVLYDRLEHVEYTVNPDENRFDFELLRGDGEIVIEFN